jgi:drug/metabolite transporter (DMT)-like permease
MPGEATARSRAIASSVHIFSALSRILPAVTTSLTLLLVPVIGLLSSLIFLAEQINATLIVGLLLIGCAVAAVNVADAKESGQRLFER